MAFDIYETITDRIISELEGGNIPWEKPWVCSNVPAVSHVTLRPYSLLNQMLLGKPGEYLTFKQVADEGGKVKKGAKSKIVVFWKPLDVAEKGANGAVITDSNGDPLMKTIFYLRYYNVFHIDDCEGIKPKLPELPLNDDIKPIELAEKTLSDYVTRSGVKLQNVKQDEAFYRPSTDEIVLPLIEQFSDASEYYSTAFHEATHSTGHSSRLNRLDGSKAAAFGSEEYSKEELVAEIGSAGIMNLLGIETAHSFRNTAAYIQSWLKALKDDKRLIVSAASRAEKAIDFIMGKDVATAEAVA